MAVAAGAAEPPVVFWTSDGVAPGDVVLAYGGGLAAADSVGVWRLADDDPASPPAPVGAPALAAPAAAAPAAAVTVTVKPLQPTADSLKFVLPATLAPGAYGVQVRAGDAAGP